MKRPLLFKTLAISFLMLLLLIPIAMIDGSINERKYYSQQVVEDIARSSSFHQTLVGPLVIVPYSKLIRTARYNEKGEKIIEESWINGRLEFLPETFNLDSQLKTELRKRGIYAARLYHSDNKITGEFLIPENFGIKENLEDYEFEQPFITMGINDIRGIGNSLVMQIDNQNFAMEPGSSVSWLTNGVHAELTSMNFSGAKRFTYQLELKLSGTESLSIVPVGRETRVVLNSDWPHPKFMGNFLPVDSSISAKGFNATWQTSFFATNMQEFFNDCARNNSSCSDFYDKQFGVEFINPVDQYVKSDRAIKYAILFIGLTFACFFLFEIMKRLQVHAVQYTLVGLALAFFYLLLLSLSEHIGFGLAYIISASACVSLIGVYVCFVLRSVIRGIGFAFGLGLLYALLYGLLSAEDYALLMGSILLFSILAVVMILTRNVDWYAIGKPATSDKKSLDGLDLVMRE